MQVGVSRPQTVQPSPQSAEEALGEEVIHKMMSGCCLISSCIPEDFCGVPVGCVREEKTGEGGLFFCTCSSYKETQPVVPPPTTSASQQAGRQAGLERPGNLLEKVNSFIPLQDILSLLMFSAQ